MSRHHSGNRKIDYNQSKGPLSVEIEGKESMNEDHPTEHPGHGQEDSESVGEKEERMEISPARHPEI